MNVFPFLPYKSYIVCKTDHMLKRKGNSGNVKNHLESSYLRHHH